MGIYSVKPICDKHKEDFRPFQMWGRTFMVCDSCTSPVKKKPKLIIKNRDRAIAANVVADKKKIDKYYWKDKRVLQRDILTGRRKAAKWKPKYHEFEGASFDKSIIKNRKLK